MGIDRDLQALADAAGILRRWEEADGRIRHADEETVRRVLEDMGYPAGDAARVEGSRRRLAEEARRLVPPAWPIRMGREPLEVPVATPPGATRVEWSLMTESGEEREGTTSDGGPVRLPEDLAAGYHDLRVRSGSSEAEVRLIVAPPACWRPDWMEADDRVVGVTAPMYALRAEEDQGIGDFGALRTMVRTVAGLGAGSVALSPLHALFPAQPQRDSPYSPSSRRWLDTRYIDVVAAVSESGGPHPLSPAPASADRVDPVQVTEWKRRVLRATFDDLQQGGWERQSVLQEEFEGFIREGGTDLLGFARFHTRHRRSGGRPWWDWPEAGTREDAGGEDAEIRFEMFLQWLAARQFAAVAREARTRLSLGLVGDLAVGTPRDSCDVWIQPDLYGLESQIGAPPDPFNPRGQDWALTPRIPRRLEAEGYGPWADLLRSGMRGMAALRIDHAMTLERLYWIPRGLSAERGVYVRYPSRGLFAVLALESHRQRCAVIAEDLGTVPAGFRERLREEKILSTRLVIFERGPDGGFTSPSEYPREAVIAAGSHDLPPLKSWLEGRDIHLRERLGLLDPNDPEGTALGRRAQDRERLLEVLQAEGLLPEDLLPSGEATVPEVVLALIAFLGRAASVLRILGLEDLLLMPDPLNVPGTTTEYPNWRIRMPRTVESLASDAFFRSCLDAASRQDRDRPRYRPPKR